MSSDRQREEITAAGGTAWRLQDVDVPGNQAVVGVGCEAMEAVIFIDDLRGEEAHRWLKFSGVWHFTRSFLCSESLSMDEGWDGWLLERARPPTQPLQTTWGEPLHHYLFALEGHGTFEVAAREWEFGGIAWTPDDCPTGDESESLDREGLPGGGSAGDLSGAASAAAEIGSPS